MSRQVEVHGKRDVFTYTEFWHTSFCLLELAKENDQGSTHQLRGSLVFAAFSFEAYLNHLGPKLFKTWNSLERLSPRQKLDVITERIEIEPDYGRLPYQIVSELFRFRNDITHGKSVTLEKKELRSLEDYNKDPYYLKMRTNWEKFCTLDNVELARKNIEAIVHELHKATGIEGEYPFVHGMTIGGGSLVE